MVCLVCQYLDSRNRSFGHAATNERWFHIIFTGIFQLLLVLCNSFPPRFEVWTKAGYILDMHGCTY